MKVLCGEVRSEPHRPRSSCAATREGRSEALTGDSAGQPLSGENQLRSADAFRPAEGNTAHVAIARQSRSAPRRRRHLACADAPWSGTGISLGRPCGVVQGPRREGRRPKPTMNGPEKSDSPIVAVKPANEAARAAEEQVEPRGGTKRECGLQQTTVRTQSREARVTCAVLAYEKP